MSLPVTPPGRTYAHPVPFRPYALLAMCVVVLSGCSGGGGVTAAPTSAATSPAQTPSSLLTEPRGCPSAAPTDFRWPEEVPDDLPTPPGARLTEVQERSDGLTVVMFTTPISIRDAVLFLIEQMPAAGYTLARGDAENAEADAPFVKDDLRGVMRMLAVEECRTDWLMAITTGVPAGGPGGGTPLLPPRPGASPLPFG